MIADLEPQYDPLCGRCGGHSGPEGAWCDNCNRECKEYTRRLDLQRFPELDTAPPDWAAIFSSLSSLLCKAVGFGHRWGLIRSG